MNFHKIVVALLFWSLFYTSNAQNKPIVFRKYSDIEKEILSTLKQTGSVKSFNPMHKLKQQAETVAENTTVSATLLNTGRIRMPGEEIVAKRSEAALMICKYMPKIALSESVQVGASGIIIGEDGICLSNYHVFQPLIDKQSRLTDFDSIFFVATRSGKIYPITAVLSYNKAADIAVFKIDSKGAKLPAIPVGQDLQEGDDIHALTHPLGHFFYYSKGVVARNMCTDDTDSFSNRAEITADFAKGSSGGPLMDNYGNLVAMVTTTQSIYYTDRPQTDLQMVVKSVIPISSILRLVKNK